MVTVTQDTIDNLVRDATAVVQHLNRQAVPTLNCAVLSSRFDWSHETFDILQHGDDAAGRVEAIKDSVGVFK